VKFNDSVQASFCNELIFRVELERARGSGSMPEPESSAQSERCIELQSFRTLQGSIRRGQDTF